MIINIIDALVLLAAAVNPIDACALLQPSEISVVLGVPVEAGTRRDEGIVPQGAYSSACVWQVKQDAAPGRNFVIVNAMQWPAGSGLADTFLDAFRKAAASGEIPAQPLPRDFGDAALWWGDGLALRLGDVSVGISVFAPSLKTQHENYRAGDFEERLATHVVKHLKQRGRL